MKRYIVTGAAGFVGSHLSEALIDMGHEVVGIDAFIPYYPRELKEENLAALRQQSRFTFHEADLRTASLEPLLVGADSVVHLAAMAGLRRSWTEFEAYMSCNLLATQRLLAAAVAQGVDHFVNCSTSSVYGRFATGDETSTLQPVSPYGITKLAAEQLARAYGEQFGLDVTTLRLFSVYGPRQRPDMGYNIFIDALLTGKTITIDGDGNDSRSNTFVLDAVDGIGRVLAQPEVSKGEIYNVGGGEVVSVNEVLDMLEELTGERARTTHGPRRPGDQKRTEANVDKARAQLGYNPQMRVIDGLNAQLGWQRSR